MAEAYSRAVLRVVVAQLSQAVGFDSIQSSSLDILTNVLERYLLVLGKTTHDFGEKCGQTTPNLSDVEFSLRQLHISLSDIIDYTHQMEPVAFPHKVAKFPAPKDSNLRFPSGNNPEDFDRDEHIPLYMPTMKLAPEKPLQEVSNGTTASSENQQPKKGTFVIAGKHSQGSSSDEDDYSAGDVSNEEYASDDSLAHNPIKSRHLTKPEDIPTIEGTAPSSMMSVPSVSELDELRGSTSPTRLTSFEGIDDSHERSFGRANKPEQTMKYATARKPSRTSQDLPWHNSDKPTPNKWPVSETNIRRPSASETDDPDWLSSKKKAHDVYDPGWLQDDAASPVHLTKPPTPDVSLGSPATDKKSWLGGKDASHSDTSVSNSTSKKHLKTSKHKVGHTLSTPTQKQIQKSNLERKSSHHKLFKPGFKNSPSNKKGDLGDEPIKARIEAAERLLHSAPVAAYEPASPKSAKRKLSVQPSPKSPVRSSIEKAEKLLKHPPVENLHFSSREASPSVAKREKILEKRQDEKQDRSNFASSKSMYDAIEAVIHRASEEIVKKDEEARKKAEEAELMKFSHLVEDSSSSDSEPDVSHKAEQMLQLEERGLRETHPPTPGSSPLPTPSSSETPQSLGIDEDEDVDIDSDSDSSTKLLPKKSYDYDSFKVKSKSDKSSKKEKHKKKTKVKTNDDTPHRSHSKVKKEKHSSKPASFVTTETISEKPMKMKVKLKHLEHEEPKLFDVDKDRDRIRVTEVKHALKSSKEDKHKSKEGKHHKMKEHKKHSTPKISFETKQSSGEHDMSVEKIILKKSKSGDAKVIKPKVKEYTRSPSPPSPVASRSNLPLPKLSAAVPVMSVTPIAKEKEKKKPKKEKKKKKDRDKDRDLEREWSFEKERQPEKSRKESKDKSHHKEKHKEQDWDSRTSSRRESFDSDISSPVVPKLTLKMGASEKKFVIKQSSTGIKPSSKKRSHSSMGDSPIPAKERKVSVESVKMMSESFAAAVERKVITQTISAGPVGVYEDADGNKIWICPGCNKPDDGSPMIGCDTCDDWYHWPCVGIVKEPPDDQDWYCPRCIKRQQLAAKGKSIIKKRKKK